MDDFIYKSVDQASKNCSPTSSNCVIWQGPDIPFLKLCKGDSITKVTYELAYKVWQIFKQLEPSNYDYTCLNLEGCAPKTFQELFQAVITKVCAATTAPIGGDCCDLIPETVLYITNRLGSQASGIIPSTNYTVPVGGDGKYELQFVADAVVAPGNNLEVQVYRNGSAPSVNVKKKVDFPSIPGVTERFTTNLVVFASDINLVAGDILDLRITTSSSSDAYLNFSTYKILKIE